MDDIIVLILTLIFIIAGVYGQMKKRPPVAEPEAEHDEDKHKWGGQKFWEHLQDEWDEHEEEEAKPVQVNKGVHQTIREEYLFKPEEEAPRTYTRIQIEKKEPLPEIKRPRTGIKFSLKKAVIYSEILHRKYE